MVSVGRRTVTPERKSDAISSSCDSVGAPAICHRFTFRSTQQLSCVRDRRRLNFLAAQHARDLRHALLGIIESPDARARMAAGVLFPDEEVRRREARDLWKMRDADDLVSGCQLLQLSADDLRHPPATAGVDLVEYQRRLRRSLRCFEKCGGDCALDPPQPSTPRDP